MNAKELGRQLGEIVVNEFESKEDKEAILKFIYIAQDFFKEKNIYIIQGDKK